jgi:hypothetical protein
LLPFHGVATPKIELSEIVYLDLHNDGFDSSVANEIQANKFHDTPHIQSDPISDWHVHEHCVLDGLFLDDSLRMEKFG